MPKFIIVIIALALAGCSTTPISNADAVPVPPERHLRYTHARAGTVPVLIKRDVGMMGSACATRVFVDGELAAYVRAGEKVILNVPTGEVVFGAEPSGICAGGLVEREARLTHGKRVQFRIGADHTGSIGLYRTATR